MTESRQSGASSVEAGTRSGRGSTPAAPASQTISGGVRPLREHDRRDRDERGHPVADLVAVLELRRERRAHDLVDRVVAHSRTSISRAEPPTASR